MFNFKFLHAALVAGLLAFSGAAQAVTTTYTYGNLLTGYTGAPTAPNFATLAVTDLRNGIWSFTLAINNTLFSTFGYNAFIGSMSFDFAPDPVNNLRTTFISSNVDGVTSVGLTNGTGTGGGFSDVDFGTRFGQGSGNRLSQNDYVTWTVSGLTGSNYAASYLHLQGGPNRGSAKYSAVSAIPEPETYAMMLAGLGLMGYTARRRKTNNVS